MLAELPVSNPCFAFFISLKGERIDKGCPSLNELHIECRCIFERHPTFHCSLLNFECCYRSTLQLRKTPFVRIRDELHTLGSKDAESLVSLPQAEVSFRRRDEETLFGELVVQPRIDQQTIVRLKASIYLAKYLAARFEHETARVAE